jgi:dolichol-phosphate mannosyltransferase
MLSVVCPALNEEEGLPLFHRELCRVLDTLADVCDYEVIYSNDGSTDGTLAVLRRWASVDPRVRYVSLSRNFGHQAAILAGMEHARGDALVLMDSDLQHPPAVIPELVRSWRAGNDVVVTLRNEWRPHGLRRLTSRWFAGLLRRITPTQSRQNMSDFCLLSRRAADEMIRLREAHRWLRGLLQWMGFTTGEVTYTPAPRQVGRSKFTMARLFGLSFDALLSFSRAPLQLSFMLGVVCLLCGAGVIGRSLLGLLIPEWHIASATVWTLASIHLVGGSILCSLGLLGEYVGRIFEQVKGRPIYLIQETDETMRAALGERQRRPA